MTVTCSWTQVLYINFRSTQNQRPLVIHGDPAYPVSIHLQAGFKGTRLTQQQDEWNTRLNEVRASVEWIFRDIMTYFNLFDF